MTVQSISPFAARYEWRHPDPLTRAFELVDGVTVQGSLRFTNLVGSRAEGSAFGHAWVFRRIGIFRSRIEIRAQYASDDAAPDATIPLKFGMTGVLERAGEEPLQWTIASVAGGEAWGWTAGPDTLMTFEHRPSDDGVVAWLFSTHGRATLTPAGAARADAPLLLVAGWYLMAARRFDLVAHPPGF